MNVFIFADRLPDALQFPACERENFVIDLGANRTRFIKAETSITTEKWAKGLTTRAEERRVSTLFAGPYECVRRTREQ